MSELRGLEIVPHIAQDGTNHRSAIDDHKRVHAGSQLTRQTIRIAGLSTLQSGQRKLGRAVEGRKRANAAESLQLRRLLGCVVQESETDP